MSKCVNLKSKEFQSLVEILGINSMELSAKMGIWMDDNNTDVWPTLEQLGITNKSIKKGVDFLFEQNPELSKIGSQQQYSKYLDTIFPDSKVKDIVYHGTNKEFDKFKKPSDVGSQNRMIAFADDIEYAKIAGARRTSLKKVISALVNVTKPYPVDKLEAMELDSGYRDEVLNELKKEGVDGFAFKSDDDLATKNFNEILVFEPEQIHILGSNKDIEGFKKFVNENKVESKEISDTITVEDNFMANFQEYPEDTERSDDREEFENKKILSDSEKKNGETLSFAALTKNLAYQKNDTSNEWTNINGKIANASKKDAIELKKERAKIAQRYKLLEEKIKQSKQMSNLEQIVEFGNDAYDEVVGLLNSKITDKQLNYCKRIVDFWIKVGDFGRDRSEHILFGENPLSKLDESLNIPEKLSEIAHRMSILDDTMKKMESDLIKKEVNKQLSGNYTIKDIYKSTRDVNWAEMNAFGISDYGSPLLSAMYASMYKADAMAAKEFEAIISQIDEKFKAANKFFTEKGDRKYNLFYQEKNGQFTGDLIRVESKEYLDKKAELLEIAQSTNKPKDWQNYRDWSLGNEDYIDIRLLFPEQELSDSLKDRAEKHKSYIISKIGQRQFDKIYKKLENIIEDYGYAKNQEKLRLLQEKDISEIEKTFRLNVWEHENSPYIELDRRIGNLTDGSTNVFFNGKITYSKSGIRGLKTIAKENYSDGKPTGWYDSKYKKIAEHKETLELYNYIQEIMEYMQSILPEHLRNHVSSNTMPLVFKSITGLFSQNSAIGMANLWSSMQKSNLVNDISETEFDEVSVSTGIKKEGLKPQTFMHSDKIVKDRIRLKIIEFEANNGKEPSGNDLTQIRKDVISQLNLERSFDLPKVIKMYVGNMITYKHKSNVDDLIKISRRALDEISEISTSDAGTDQFTPDGKLRVQEGLKKTKEAFDYAIKAFEGGQLHKPEGRIDIGGKKFTYLEKKEMAELLAVKDKLQIQLDNGKITKEKFAEDSAIIENKIDKLGGYIYMSRVGDNLLKYTQLKGMGLNFIAGGVNLLTGWMENSIKAADGRWFNETQFNQGLKDAYSTVFDPFGKLKSTRKLIAIEKYFHLVEDASQELYQHKDKFTDAAFIITKKTEFINVMSMTGAFLRNIPVINDKNETSNLFEAFDENGNIKSGWKLSEIKSNDEFLLDVDLGMRKIKHKIHGNYSDRLKGKETIFGRMAFQFRTWMPELFNARFGKTQFDPILQKEVGGRWWSMKTLAGSKFNGNEFTAADNILYTLGQLGRKVLFMRTSFDGRMSESDAANMRANMMELHFMLGLMALMLILKAAVPDEDKKNNFTYNFLINMIIRQQNDIMVFANPMTFEQINKNVLPIMGVLSDTNSLIRSVKNEFSEDERKSGKSLTKLAKMVPPFGQAVRVYQYGDKVIAQQ